MKKSVILSFLLAIILISGCAYYNIFFNAKRYYNKGYEATKKNRTDKVNSTETQNYQKAVEKSATLIQEYPDSKWVDDAIMLMGKSYYYQQSYLKAERKFYELITHYPESEYVLEAKLWQAKTKVALEEFKEAEVQFAQLLEQDLPKDLRGEASLYLGELYEEQEFYDRAVTAYLQAVEDGMKELRADAMFSAAACYDSLQQYSKAADAYSNVLKYNPSQELRFDTRMKYAEMRKEMGEHDEAIHDFEVLLGDQRFKKEHPQIRLQIAECLARKGDFNGAIISYEDITDDEELKKTRYAGKAFYELGNLYESAYQDYDRAYDHFKQVKPLASRTTFADSAEMKARDIERFKALTEVIHMGMKGESGALELELEEIDEDTMNTDILFTRLDTTHVDSSKLALITQLLGKTFLDSLLEESELTEEEMRLPQWQRRLEERDARGGIDWIAWLEDDAMPSEDELIEEVPYIERYRLKAERPDILNSDALRVFNVEELDKNLIFIAELYWFRFNLPDSAANQYRYIIRQIPDSELRPKALYNYAYLLANQFQDTTQSDSVYKTLIEQYPGTPYAKRARQWLGLPAVNVAVDSVGQHFQEAEQRLFAMKDPQGAYTIYESIFLDFPDSRWAPKALYGMGWISENSMGEQDEAFALYDSLLVLYPESEFAQKVKPKIDAVQNEEKRLIQERERAEAARADSISKALEQTAQSDSVLTDSNAVEIPEMKSSADSTLSQSESPAESVKRRIDKNMERVLQDLESDAPASPDSEKNLSEKEKLDAIEPTTNEPEKEPNQTRDSKSAFEK